MTIPKTIDDLLAMGKKDGEETPPATPPVETPPANEPPATPPVEVPPAPPAETPADEDEDDKDRNSFLESIKSVTPKEEAPAEPPAPPAIDPEIQAKLAKLEELEAKVKFFEEDPLAKALELNATPEQLKAIAKELVESDTSTKTVDELIEIAVKSQFGDLTPEELDEIVSREKIDFENLSPLAQKEKEKSLKEYVKTTSTGSKTLEKLQAAYQEKLSANQQPDNTALIAEAKQAEEAERTYISEYGKSLLGKKLYGVEFTQEHLDSIAKEYSLDKGTKFLNDKGQIDVSKLIVKDFMEKNMDVMIENEVQARVKKALKGQLVDPKLQHKGGTPNGQEHPNIQKMKDMGMPQYIIEAERKKLNS